MSRFVLVFGTSHRLQGLDKGQCNINDPSYSDPVETLISKEKIDFIFEEATGLGPTTAERLAFCHFGQGRYADVDPPRSDRHKHGVSDDTEQCIPIDPYDPQRSKDIAYWEFVEAHERRENIWLQRVKDSAFSNALMICGYVHTLSFAFRLRSVGFSVKAIHYMPCHKLV